MSQETVAGLIGCDQATISNLETAKQPTRFALLLELVRLYEVSPVWLFSEANEDERHIKLSIKYAKLKGKSPDDPCWDYIESIMDTRLKEVE